MKRFKGLKKLFIINDVITIVLEVIDEFIDLISIINSFMQQNYYLISVMESVVLGKKYQ